jgi:hypothetical protein
MPGPGKGLTAALVSTVQIATRYGSHSSAGLRLMNDRGIPRRSRGSGKSWAGECRCILVARSSLCALRIGHPHRAIPARLVAHRRERAAQRRAHAAVTLNRNPVRAEI